MPKQLRGLSYFKALLLHALSLAALLAMATAPVHADGKKPAGITLRYLGHSCFLITTPAGKRIVIDPFAGGEWPGMRFPPVEADIVLISHPHWDHSSAYEVKGSPKVFTGTGVVEEGDARMQGFPGRHAVTGGEPIGFLNTVWVIRAGDVRVCHLGDNGPLEESPGLAEAIGGVDVLLLPIDSERRVLAYDQARAWMETLAPRLVIPMHYRAPGLTFEQVTGLGTPDEWLSGQAGYQRVPGDTLKVDPGSADPAIWPPQGTLAVRVLTLPGEKMRARTTGVAGRAEAIEAKRRAGVALAGGDTATALTELQRAVELDPGDADGLQKIGFIHLNARRPDLAADFLSRAARAAGMEDGRLASLSWLGAGMALDLLGKRDDAKAAYQAVIGLGHNEEQQVDQARQYLETPYQED